MKTIIIKAFFILLLTSQFAQGQDDPFTQINDTDGLNEDQLIQRKFTESIIKLGIYAAQIVDEDLVITISETQMVTAQAAALAIGNPTWENLREYFITNLLPDYSRQGTYLETIYDKELMRNVDQYVKYAETAMSYGFNMTSADREVRTYLSPEKNLGEEFMEMDGVAPLEPTYNGDTAAQYQTKIMNLYQDIAAYEYTGDPAIDDAVVTAMAYTYFEDEDTHAQVLGNIVTMQEVEFTGDPLLDNEIMMGYFDEMFVEMEPDEIEEVEVIVEAGEEGYENGLNGLLADMGVENRDPRARYGDAAAPFYNRMATSANERNEEAQVALTNIFNTWEALQVADNIEKAIEMERLVRFIYENYDDINLDRLEQLTGALQEIWDAIKEAKANN